MPSLNLSNLFRRDAVPTLRERAANLRAQVSTRVAESHPPGEGMAMAAPEHNAPATETDSELLRLGRLFEAASAREKAANEACNAAHREAGRHMPERPAVLFFRGSDHPLRLGKHLTHPDHLEGVEITSEDIAWMKRKPYVREVRRPVRPEDNLPPDAHTCVDTYPWPEAQERADEIVTAWDAWHAEKLRIYGEHVTAAMDDAANEAGDAAASLAYRIAELPAHTAAGFRVKLRALMHFDRKALLHEHLEEADPDQALSHSLWRDAIGEAAAPPPSQACKPDPILAAIAASRQAEGEMAGFARMVAGRPITAAGRAQEKAIDAAQRETREKVWATVPTTAAGLLALLEYAKFQAGLAYGDNWRQEASKETFGDAFLALAAAIEATAPPVLTAPPPQTMLDPDRAWAIEQAAAVDLSGLTVGQLNVLYDRFDAAAGRWSDAACVPWANEADGKEFRVLNAGGRIADREDQRAAEIRSRIAAEIRTKAPTDRFDVGWRLEILIRHELLCEGSLEHAPELRAEMAEAWGG